MYPLNKSYFELQFSTPRPLAPYNMILLFICTNTSWWSCASLSLHTTTNITARTFSRCTPPPPQRFSPPCPSHTWPVFTQSDLAYDGLWAPRGSGLLRLGPLPHTTLWPFRRSAYPWRPRTLRGYIQGWYGDGTPARSPARSAPLIEYRLNASLTGIFSAWI